MLCESLPPFAALAARTVRAAFFLRSIRASPGKFCDPLIATRVNRHFALYDLPALGKIPGSNLVCVQAAANGTHNGAPEIAAYNISVRSGTQRVENGGFCFPHQMPLPGFCGAVVGLRHGCPCNHGSFDGKGCIIIPGIVRLYHLPLSALVQTGYKHVCLWLWLWLVPPGILCKKWVPLHVFNSFHSFLRQSAGDDNLPGVTFCRVSEGLRLKRSICTLLQSQRSPGSRLAPQRGQVT